MPKTKRTTYPFCFKSKLFTINLIKLALHLDDICETKNFAIKWYIFLIGRGMGKRFVVV